MEILPTIGSQPTMGKSGAFCFREHTLRTAAASAALQLFCLGFLVIFAPWSDWKAQVATPLASFEFVQRGTLTLDRKSVV